MKINIRGQIGGESRGTLLLLARAKRTPQQIYKYENYAFIYYLYTEETCESCHTGFTVGV